MGENIAYTCEVKNVGIGLVDSVSVLTGIPDEFYIVSCNGDGVFDGDLKKWNLSNIGPGEKRSIKVIISQQTYSGNFLKSVISKVVDEVPIDENLDNNESEFKIHLGKKSNSDLFAFTCPEKPFVEVGD